MRNATNILSVQVRWWSLHTTHYTTWLQSEITHNNLSWSSVTTELSYSSFSSSTPDAGIIQDHIKSEIFIDNLSALTLKTVETEIEEIKIELLHWKMLSLLSYCNISAVVNSQTLSSEEAHLQIEKYSTIKIIALPGASVTLSRAETGD